jgi:cyanate permease
VTVLGRVLAVAAVLGWPLALALELGGAAWPVTVAWWTVLAAFAAGAWCPVCRERGKRDRR